MPVLLLGVVGIEWVSASGPGSVYRPRPVAQPQIGADTQSMDDVGGVVSDAGQHGGEGAVLGFLHGQAAATGSGLHVASSPFRSYRAGRSLAIWLAK